MWISGAVESSRVKMKYSPLGEQRFNRGMLSRGNIQLKLKLSSYLTFANSSYWHSSAVLLDWSLQKKNFPLKSWTPTMAKMSRKRM